MDKGPSAERRERVTMATPLTTESFWRGNRIRLRALSKADAVHWLALDEDSDAIRKLNLGISLPRSPDQAAAWADRFADFNNADEAMIFAIETHDGDYVGSLNLAGVDRRHGRFSTGTRLARAYRGKGWRRSVSSYVTRSMNCGCRSTTCTVLKPIQPRFGMPSCWVANWRVESDATSSRTGDSMTSCFSG